MSEIYLCFSKLFLWLQTVFCTCISILPATTKPQRPNGNCTDWSSEDFEVHCIKAYRKQYLWHLYQFNAEYSRWNSCASKQQFSKMRFIQAPTHTFTYLHIPTQNDDTKDEKENSLLWSRMWKMRFLTPVPLFVFFHSFATDRALNLFSSFKTKIHCKKT